MLQNQLLPSNAPHLLKQSSNSLLQFSALEKHLDMLQRCNAEKKHQICVHILRLCVYVRARACVCVWR